MKIKNVYIIAGPNGSGKTTFAREFLPGYARCPNFVNADLIAQGLSPFSPAAAAIKSGRLVLEEIRRFAHKHAEFGFETTLSGKSYVNLLKVLKRQGYKLHLFFLWVPGPDLAVARIKDRVAEGGHNVPVQDVKRRFNRSISNFFRLYEPLLDSWMFFNNAESVPILIAKRKNGQAEIIDRELFQGIQRNVKEQ
ncbi:MAG: zeta toxin family protein [Candidatus Omnitrophica bacterium]|nr:zeta toxin family protein [Candidatus Omnitrophota bacterium]